MDSIFHQEDRKVRVHIEAGGYSCEGLVHLPGIRLSDVLNERNPFLVLVQATVTHEKPGEAASEPLELGTIFINKSDIKYMIPVDEARLADM